MTERSYEDAVQALRDRLGGRWEGREADGRDEMTRLLTETQGYDQNDAGLVIDSLIRSGQLRYHTLRESTASSAESTADEPGIIAVGTQTTSSGLPGAPIAPGVDFAPGYWEIGQDGGSDEFSGRKGQVTPL